MTACRLLMEQQRVKIKSSIACFSFNPAKVVHGKFVAVGLEVDVELRLAAKSAFLVNVVNPPKAALAKGCDHRG